MTWIEAKGGWGKIVDGKLAKPCSLIRSADPAAGPPAKKAKKAPLQNTPPAASSAATSSTSVAQSAGSLDPAMPPIAGASATLREIDRDCEEFWKLEETLAAHVHGRNEDYNEKRIKAGKKPISFVLAAAQVSPAPKRQPRKLHMYASNAKDGTEDSLNLLTCVQGATIGFTNKQPVSGCVRPLFPDLIEGIVSDGIMQPSPVDI